MEDTEEVDRDGESDLTGTRLGEQVLLHSSFRAKRGFEPGPWCGVDSLVSESMSSCVTKNKPGLSLNMR